MTTTMIGMAILKPMAVLAFMLEKPLDTVRSNGTSNSQPHRPSAPNTIAAAPNAAATWRAKICVRLAVPPICIAAAAEKAALPRALSLAAKGK